jgi:hypothetical protein
VLVALPAATRALPFGILGGPVNTLGSCRYRWIGCDAAREEALLHSDHLGTLLGRNSRRSTERPTARMGNAGRLL